MCQAQAAGAVESLSASASHVKPFSAVAHKREAADHSAWAVDSLVELVILIGTLAVPAAGTPEMEQPFVFERID